MCGYVWTAYIRKIILIRSLFHLLYSLELMMSWVWLALVWADKAMKWER